MEGKLQEHKQELERMKKGIVLDKKKLLQETDLKKKVKEVGKCSVYTEAGPSSGRRGQAVEEVWLDSYKMENLLLEIRKTINSNSIL